MSHKYFSFQVRYFQFQNRDIMKLGSVKGIQALKMNMYTNIIVLLYNN